MSTRTELQRYSRDPIKREVREKERDFIASSLRGNPADWVAAFIPGPNGDEIDEVFTPLGFRPEHLIGIENSREVMKYWGIGNPEIGSVYTHPKWGIWVYYGDVKDFPLNAYMEGQLDCVILDLESNFSSRTKNVISNFRRSRGGNGGYASMLAPRCVFGLTTYGRQESKDSQEELDLSIFAEIEHLDHGLTEGVRDMVLRGIKPRDIVAKLGFNTLAISRDRGIVHAILSLFFHDPYVSSIYQRTPNREEKEESELNRLLEEAKKFGVDAKRNGKTITANGAILGVDGMLADNLIEYLDSLGYPRGMAQLALSAVGNMYFLEGVESYWYRSIKGSPMFVDFFLFDEHRETVDKYKDLANKIYRGLEDAHVVFPDKGFKPIHAHSERERRRQVARLHAKMLRTVLADIEALKRFRSNDKLAYTVERVYLGSSSPSGVTGREYYQLRIAASNDGVPVENLHERLLKERAVSRAQLEAYENHVQMGVHGPPPREQTLDELETTLIIQPTEIPKFYLRDLLPREYRRNSQRFSGSQMLRMQYFINDLYDLLNPEEMQSMFSNIKASRWYSLGNKIPTDTQVYAFFDDLTILARNGHIPDTSVVVRTYQSVLNGGTSPDVRRYVN